MTIVAMLLIIVCVFSYTGQNFFNKMFSVHYTGPDAAATSVFAAIYGILVGCVTLAYNGFAFRADTMTVFFGVSNGMILFLFNLSAINAARRGPFAFQSLVMLLGNTIMPLVFSLVWWGDRLTALKIAGIAVMVVSFILFNMKGLNFEGVKKGYFFWVILLFVTNGVYGILMDSQQRLAMQTMRNEMIILTFFSSAVISLVFLAFAEKGNMLRAFSMSGRVWASAIGSSVCAAIAVNALMICLVHVPVGVLYTVNNGGVLVMSALLSAVTLKEKLSRNMIAGIAVAVVSLVMLSV